MFEVSRHISRNSELKSQRAPCDAVWQEIAELALPRHAHFSGANQSPGSDRTRKLHDSHGVSALSTGITVFEGLVMPRGALWQLLSTRDAELMRIQRVAEWCERKTEQLFGLRADHESGFVSQAHESVASLLAFGNQSMWCDLRRDAYGNPVGLRYISEHLGSVVIEEDAQGQVIRTHREMRMSARDALQKFGARALAKAPKVLEAASDPKKETHEFEFLHVILPNAQMREGNMDWRGMPIVGLYISCADKEIFDIGGYRSPPRTYSRYDKSSNEVYGRGPAIDVLPELRQIQDLAVNILVGAELAAMPPLGAHSDMMDQNINYGPHGISYGAIDDRGNVMVRPLFEQTDLSHFYGHRDKLHSHIDDAFFASLLLSNTEVKTHVSATEIAERRAEAGMLLSPLSRQEDEWFSRLLARELDLMNEMGLFDDMPPEVEEAGGLMQVRYDNPLNQLMAGDAAAGFFRTAEQVGAVAAFYPDVASIFAQAFPLEKVLPQLAKINAVPASWHATEEEAAAAREGSEQQAAMQQMVELLPAVGKTARDMSVASQGVPNAQPI